MFGDPVDNPRGWETKGLLELGKCKNGMNFRAGESGVNVHCLGVGDFKDNSQICDTSVLPKISLNKMPPEEVMLQDGDIVFVRSNGNKMLVGRCLVIFPGDIPTTYSGFCIRFRKEAECVDTTYLVQLLKADSTRSKMAGRGANIQNLNQQILGALQIPIPPIELQQEFKDFIKQSDKSKFTGFKSQFIEMFGRPGYDDKGWGLTTLGECCELNPRRAQGIDDALEVSFLAMPSVSEDGHMDTKVIRPYSEVKKGFTYFAEKDVLFAKITPCMENGKGAVAEGLSNGIGAGSTEFHVLRPIPQKSNPYWMYIITMFEAFRINARKVMTGTGGQLRVPINYLKDYPITLPPIELQNEFEKFYRQSDKSK